MPTLGSLVGQETAVRALRRALSSDCLPGTYLFTGPDGIGKLALAQAFAQAAACLSPVRETFDACGVCDSCRRAESGAQPDIITVRPAGEQLQIWQFWDRPGRPAGVLSRTLPFAPIVGRRRVTIIEKADRLNEPTANSLLKSLEEPPPYALFILLAPHPARVLPTILSRSQVVRLSAMSRPELAGYLKERLGLDPNRAEMIAAYSEGRVGQALTLAGAPAIAEEIQRVLDFAESLPDAPHYRALRCAEQLRKLASQTKLLSGDEQQEAAPPSTPDSDASAAREKTARKQFAAVFDLLVAFYRDLFAIAVGSELEDVVNRDREQALARLAGSGSAARWSACLNALLLARRRLDANANTTLVTDILLMNLLAR